MIKAEICILTTVISYFHSAKLSQRFYEATVEGRSLRSSAGVGQEEEEEESGDEEEEGEKDTFPSWKKTIMIGPSYQASVPSGTTNYDDRFDKTIF